MQRAAGGKYTKRGQNRSFGYSGRPQENPTDQLSCVLSQIATFGLRNVLKYTYIPNMGSRERKHDLRLPCRASALKALTLTFALFFIQHTESSCPLPIIFTPANNLISRPLNAAAAVCKVREGDTDRGSSQQLSEQRERVQPPRSR